MEDREILEQLAQHGEKWASRRARVALELDDQFAQGAITQEEFWALIEDLVNDSKLDQEATDLETKSSLVIAVYGIAQVI